MRMKAAQRRGGSHRWELTRLRAWCARHPERGWCAQPTLARTRVHDRVEIRAHDSSEMVINVMRKLHSGVPSREASGGPFSPRARASYVYAIQRVIRRAARVLRQVAPARQSGPEAVRLRDGCVRRFAAPSPSLAHDHSHQFARSHPRERARAPARVRGCRGRAGVSRQRRWCGISGRSRRADFAQMTALPRGAPRIALGRAVRDPAPRARGAADLVRRYREVSLPPSGRTGDRDGRDPGRADG